MPPGRAELPARPERTPCRRRCSARLAGPAPGRQHAGAFGGRALGGAARRRLARRARRRGRGGRRGRHRPGRAGRASSPAAPRPATAAAVLQAANHEVGTRQPVAEAAERLAGPGVPLVVDAGHELVYGRPPAPAPVFTADARLWGGPAGVGLLVVRRGTRWRPPFPADEAERGRSAGPPNVPAIVAAVAALRASRAGARGRGRPAGRAGRPAPRAGAGDRAGHGGARRPGRPAAAPGHLLLPVRRRRGAAHRAGPARLRGVVRLVVHLRHADPVARAGRDGRADLGQRPGLAAPGGRARPTWSGSWRCCRTRWPTPGAGAGCRLDRRRPPVRRGQPGRPSQPDAVLDSRGRRCPLPVLDLARALPGVPVGAELTVLADDPAAASDIAAWCRMRGQRAGLAATAATAAPALPGAAACAEPAGDVGRLTP